MKMFKNDNSFCCVPQCNSKGSRDPELSFHRFPRLPDKPHSGSFINYAARVAHVNRRRQDWIRILRIGKEVTPRMTVCSKHFKETDYTRPWRPTLMPRLKPLAVPSLCLPVTDNAEKSTKKYQAAKKRNAGNKVSNRSVKHSATTMNKRKLLNKAVNKLKIDPINASEKDLKLCTIDLWQKNEELKKNIESLHNEGYKEEDYRWYTDTLRDHHYIKNLAIRIMEMLADIENTTIPKVHEEFGMRELITRHC